MGRPKKQKTENMECIIAEDNCASSSAEEPSGDGNSAGSCALKKGPWTPEEDKILEAYVNKHGEGNWNAVQKFSGLSRCGKSCRLRWANHLRPNLKKGAFTPEEEDLIIRLHAELGNKWARMASKLPGRTDNEIKNFWNTRTKRLQRAGHSIYPPDVEQLKKSSETQQSQVSDSFSAEVQLPRNFNEAIFEIPPFVMADSVPYQMDLLDSLTREMLPQGLFPSHGFSTPLHSIHRQKRLRELDTSHGLCDTATSSPSRQRNGNASKTYHHQPYELPNLPESYRGVCNPSLYFFPGSHAFNNGNRSTSEPDFGSVKSELPSFQSSDLDLSFCNSHSFSLPPLEFNDTEVQFPQIEPCQVQSPLATDGLLESVVWPQNGPKSPEMETTPTDKTTYNLDDLPDLSGSEWDDIDLNYAALLSYGPLCEGAIDDKAQQTDKIIPGHQANASEVEPHQHQAGNHVIEADRLDSSKPDALLDANILSPDTEQGREFSTYKKALSQLTYFQQLQPQPLDFQGANSTVGAVPSI